MTAADHARDFFDSVIVAPDEVLVLTFKTPMDAEEIANIARIMPGALMGRVIFIDGKTVDVDVKRTVLDGIVVSDECKTHNRPYIECRELYGTHRGNL